MLVNLIAAVDRDWVIGADQTMPWPRQPDDMADFKAKTTGHAVIMGRRTAESIGKPLPNRFNIVLTRQGKFIDIAAEKFYTEDNLLDALQTARTEGFKETWIIGGADIYTQAMENNLVDNIHINHLPLHADTTDHKTGQDYIEYTYFPRDLLDQKYQPEGMSYADIKMRDDGSGKLESSGIVRAQYVPRQRRLFP